MTDWLVELLKEYGPLLVRIAGLLIVLLAAPLLVLAWWRKVYPNSPLLVALAVPCVLSLALLIDARLLPLIVLIDLAIPAAALIDLFTLPRKKSFAIERETARVASVQQNHRVTLHISNLGQRPWTGWTRDDIPQEFEPNPKEFVLRLGPRSLRLLQGLLDGQRPLFHLRGQRLVEEAPQHEQQQAEIDGLDDERLVEVDESSALAAACGDRRVGRDTEQEDSDGEDSTHGEVSGGN